MPTKHIRQKYCLCLSYSIHSGAPFGSWVHTSTTESDSCLVHLQFLKIYLNISDLDDWKQNTFYATGIKLGGQICDLLWRYGLASLVPIIINMLFNISVFVDDLNANQAYTAEVLFVFILFYPQWRTIWFLGTYIYNRDEFQLNRAKDNFDVQIGALEPFIESSFQVRKI